MDKPDDQAERPSLPSAIQGAVTRQALLTAAATLVAEEGWCAVTTRAVAARAGVPHGAIGYHFSGKADLVRQAVMAAMTEALAAPIALARQAGSVAELVEATLGWFAAGGLADPSVALLLESSREAPRDPILAEAIAAMLRDYRAAVTDLARRDQERGVIPAALPADGVAAVAAAMLDGLLLHYVFDPDLSTAAIATAAIGLLGGYR